MSKYDFEYEKGVFTGLLDKDIKVAISYGIDDVTLINCNSMSTLIYMLTGDTLDLGHRFSVKQIREFETIRKEKVDEYVKCKQLKEELNK